MAYSFRNPDPEAIAHWERIVAAFPADMFKFLPPPPTLWMDLTSSEEKDVERFLKRRSEIMAERDKLKSA